MLSQNRVLSGGNAHCFKDGGRARRVDYRLRYRCTHSSRPAFLTNATVLAVKLVTAMAAVLPVWDAGLGVECKTEEERKRREDGELHDT